MPWAIPKITPETVIAVQCPNPAILSKRNLRKTNSSIIGAMITATTKISQGSIDKIISCTSLAIGSSFKTPTAVIRTVPIRLPIYRTPILNIKNALIFPIPHCSLPISPVDGTNFIKKPVKGTARGYILNIVSNI